MACKFFLIALAQAFGAIGNPALATFETQEFSAALVGQAFLGWIFLASMSFEWYEAAGLFVLWVVQFCVPSLRHEMVWVYAAWIAVELVLVALRKKRILAFAAFSRSWRRGR